MAGRFLAPLFHYRAGTGLNQAESLAPGVAAIRFGNRRP
jgi:hypothetical protein